MDYDLDLDADYLEGEFYPDTGHVLSAFGLGLGAGVSGTQSSSGPLSGDGILLEDGSGYLLMESGDFLLLE